ncbi:uncharacterized protein CCR75_005983 [Bremia lactucae]|uniref:Uncharacterized protein n=1 Tax=Bremia lactucae TaxID=4779 RepID=A0A976FRW7_BRELC|nr:hypothetical protein CCR75_005983 [Bremia lactucae]
MFQAVISMDTLRNVELHLSRVVVIVQQRLLSRDALDHNRAPSNVESAQVLFNIDRLQETLRVATKMLAARVSQFSALATSNENVQAPDSSSNINLASDTDTEDEVDRQKETVLCVGKKRMRESDTGDEKEDPCANRSNMQNEREEQLEASIQDYAESVAEAAQIYAMMPPELLQTRLNAFGRTPFIAMCTLAKFIEDGGIPRLVVAESFRDTTILLPRVVAQNQEFKGTSRRWIFKISKRLRLILDLAKKSCHLPAPLKDPQLKRARSALIDYEAVSNQLYKMSTFIKKVESQSTELTAGTIETSLERLVCAYHGYFKLFGRLQRYGMTQPQSEECWAQFARIGDALAQWIQRAQQMILPPKLRANLSRFSWELRKFAEKYPNRVPTTLLAVSCAFTELMQPEAELKHEK